MIALRRVLAIRQRQNLDRPSTLPADRHDLCHSSVLIFDSLNGEDGAVIRGRYSSIFQLRNSGLSQVVSSPERALRVPVMACQKSRQVGGFESQFGRGNAANTEFFDEDVWREQTSPRTESRAPA